MAKGEKIKVDKEDPIDAVNNLELDAFVGMYLMSGEKWKLWTHPKTGTNYEVFITTTRAISNADFDSCFKLIELTSSADYKKSKDGWKPRYKRSEMMLLDLKYLLVRNPDGNVEGFCSFMPTYEDDIPVLYCYEIHLGLGLQGTGLGSILMGYLEVIASKLPDVKKVMLTVFVYNEKAALFYKRLGFEKDKFSPPPQMLRNGTKVEKDYLILSKPISR